MTHTRARVINESHWTYSRERERGGESVGVEHRSLIVQLRKYYQAACGNDCVMHRPRIRGRCETQTLVWLAAFWMHEVTACRAISYEKNEIYLLLKYDTDVARNIKEALRARERIYVAESKSISHITLARANYSWHFWPISSEIYIHVPNFHILAL